MKYKRGKILVVDRTAESCHRRCVEYTSNRVDGQAREAVATNLARLMINSRLGQEGEKEMTVNVIAGMACRGPSANGSCNVEFPIERTYE